MKLKPKMCPCLKLKVKYLGHLVCTKGIRRDPQKTETVEDFPRPTNLRDVREFLGSIDYHRRDVDQFATLAKPLIALTLKNAKSEWTDEVETPFRT